MKPIITNFKVGNIEAQVIRKPIKNMYLSVNPPAGMVKVSAPIRAKDSDIRTLIADKSGWIIKKQDEIKSKARHTSPEYVSGETHYLWGEPYTLDVMQQDQPPEVRLNGSQKILLSVRPGSTLAERHFAMIEWYPQKLREAAGERIDHWQDVTGIGINEWRIKRMKTRWGTCNVRAKRIWLNLHLAKRSKSCLDFIIVHELVHMLERKHNDRFKGYMDRFMPDWKERKGELDKATARM